MEHEALPALRQSVLVRMSEASIMVVNEIECNAGVHGKYTTMTLVHEGEAKGLDKSEGQNKEKNNDPWEYLRGVSRLG